MSNTKKKAPVGPPKKSDNAKRTNFSVSFALTTISAMDKQLGIIPRSRYIEEAVLTKLKKGNK